MTETNEPDEAARLPALPEKEARPEQEQTPEGQTKPAKEAKSWDPLPLLFGLGVIVLLAAVVYLWQHPLQRPQPQSPSATAPAAVQPSQPSSEISTIDARLQALSQRLEAVEHRAPAEAADTHSLESRIAALEQRATEVPAMGSGGGDQASAKMLQALTARLEALERQQKTLADELAATSSALNQRLDSVESRLAAAEQLGQALAKQKQNAIAADRALRMARIAAAGVALQLGLPLGEIPGAPPALARFAASPPPTEAALRASFAQAARAAQEASSHVAGPAATRSFWQQLWQRLGAWVTVRQGGRVILGDPTEAIIADAEAALIAGDLAQALKLVQSLQGPPAEAFAAWRTQAEALLAAREALSGMAAGA
jgi:hypothetical protein